MEIKPFNLNILPRKSMTWEEFLSSAPKNSIALDGVDLGARRIIQKKNHVNYEYFYASLFCNKRKYDGFFY